MKRNIGVPIAVGHYYYYGFFPIFRIFPYISETIGPTAKNGFQIRILHQKIHNIKDKKKIVYMPLKLNNTEILWNLLINKGTSLHYQQLIS